MKTFLERDKLIAFYEGLIQYFVETREHIAKTIPIDSYTPRTIFENNEPYFSEVTLKHSLTKNIEFLRIDQQTKMLLYIRMNKSIRSVIISKEYTKSIYIVDEIFSYNNGKITISGNIKEDVYKNKYFPPSVNDWNDEHFTLFKLTYL